MKQKFYSCKHCGNIIAMVRDKGIPVCCCSEKRILFRGCFIAL